MTTPTQRAIDEIHATLKCLRDEITSIRAAQESDLQVLARFNDRLLRMENISVKLLGESRA